MGTQTSRERMIARIVELVEGFFASLEQCGGRAGLYVAEHSALRTALKIARELLQAWLDRGHAGHCGPRHVDAHGCVRVFKQYVVRTIETIVGVVRIRLAQYHRRGADPGCVCPLGDDLGLGPGRYSPGLEELIVLGAVQDVYRQPLSVLQRLLGVSVSVKKSETTVAAWGRRARERRLAHAEHQPSGRERIASTRPIEGLRMCVTTDGVKVHTTGGWSEAKLIAAYPFDEQGRRAGPVQYRGTLDYADAFGPLLWDVVQQTQAHRAEHLIWLGDGAAWIWNQQQTVAPHAAGIVDFYHAADRLWKVGRALYASAAQARRWSKRWISKLYNGKIDSLPPALLRQARRLGDPPKNCDDDDPRKIVADALSYFTNNAPRMHYKRYRAKGYPIGSGVVESACRHIVGLRMKRTAAMKWEPTNAEAMIELRTVWASRDWDRFWGLEPLWHHIRNAA